MYSVLADSNNLALAIENGTEFPDNNQILAIAKFGQALTMGYLALNYDGVCFLMKLELLEMENQITMLQWRLRLEN